MHLRFHPLKITMPLSPSLSIYAMGATQGGRGNDIEHSRRRRKKNQTGKPGLVISEWGRELSSSASG